MAAQRKSNPRESAASRMVAAVMAGLAPLRVEPPIRMSEWSRKNFYLSRESSQSEGGWDPWRQQVAIMDCMGDDDIEEVNYKKSARCGYTKMMVCSMLYFAHHKKRNQAMWQPTDSDKDEFVKEELEPALRDVPCMDDIFPEELRLRKNKKNTLDAKIFLTGILHTKGGTAATSYRRITVSVGYFDELSGFPADIQGEGRAFNLGAKRTEGAVFPKMIGGSTPKLAGSCQISERANQAQEVFTYHIPCPHCEHEHALEFGSKGADKFDRGLIWFDNDPSTAVYLCPSCGATYTQPQFLAAEKLGRWINPATGIWIDVDGVDLVFRDAEGSPVPKPKHVAFQGWSAYSPQKTWESIAREWIAAVAKAATGDNSLLKTCYNITLGECWEEEVEKGDAQALIRRAEPYPLRVVPRDALTLCAFIDVQGDRFELVVWGFGRGEEMWVIDYRVFSDINPFQDGDWDILDEHLQRRYRHARGGTMAIEIAGIDTGYATHQAYRFCRTRERRRIYATKGETKEGQPIKSRVSKVDVKTRTGGKIKSGVKLNFIGTDAAKDTIWGRLQVDSPGPGYMHFSTQLPPQFYEQLVAEQRVAKSTGGQSYFKWEKPNPNVRNEVLDCTVGVLWGLEVLMERYRDPNRFWDEMERRMAQPDLMEMMENPPLDEATEGPETLAERLPMTAKPIPAPIPRSTLPPPMPLAKAAPAGCFIPE